MLSLSYQIYPPAFCIAEYIKRVFNPEFASDGWTILVDYFDGRFWWTLYGWQQKVVGDQVIMIHYPFLRCTFALTRRTRLSIGILEKLSAILIPWKPENGEILSRLVAGTRDHDGLPTCKSLIVEPLFFILKSFLNSTPGWKSGNHLGEPITIRQYLL